jgi:hypothetical protein
MLKNLDLGVFTTPLDNAMEAIWAVTLRRAFASKLYTQLSMKKSVWRAYFMDLHSDYYYFFTL